MNMKMLQQGMIIVKNSYASNGKALRAYIATEVRNPITVEECQRWDPQVAI